MRSRSTCDWFYYNRGSARDELVSFEGNIIYSKFDGTGEHTTSSRNFLHDAEPYPGDSVQANWALANVVWPHWGIFASDYTHFPAGDNYRTVVIPYRLLMALTASLPVIWVVLTAQKWARFRDSSLTLCSHCGYDLRVTPDRCPECGVRNERADLISNL